MHDLKKLTLYVFPLEGTRCGFGIQQGVLLPSLAYIPGRVIRGGLAGWAVRNGILDPEEKDGDFNNIFLDDEGPGEAEVSFPCCTRLGRLPAPCSTFEAKGRTAHPVEVFIKKEKITLVDQVYQERELGGMSSPVDFLRSDVMPAMVDVSLKPCRGTVDESGEYFPAFPTILEMKSAHQEDTGRGGDNGLYIVEVMPPNQRRNARDTYYAG